MSTVLCCILESTITEAYEKGEQFLAEILKRYMVRVVINTQGEIPLVQL